MTLGAGCGAGIQPERLRAAGLGRVPVVGLDFDLTRLVRVSRAAGGSGTALGFGSGSFPASVAVLTLQHVPDPLAAVLEMGRVTRPGGARRRVDPDRDGTSEAGGRPRSSGR